MDSKSVDPKEAARQDGIYINMERENHSRSKDTYPKAKGMRLDRRSAQGVSGGPKKGGYGGWGTVNDDLTDYPFEEGDPNYEGP